MYKNLRIIFTILSAICLAAAIPLGTFFDYAGWIGALIGAGIFFVLMLLCKQSQESAEKAAETARKKAEKAENGENDDGEMEIAPQKKLPRTTLTKPPKYRKKK